MGARGSGEFQLDLRKRKSGCSVRLLFDGCGFHSRFLATKPNDWQQARFLNSISTIEDLIAQTALGRRSAFSNLYDLTSAKLFGVCLRVLNNRAEAEDVLQEVYITVWRKADRYAVTGNSPMTWLITIARNKAIDRLRMRRETGGGLESAESVVDPAPGPERQAVENSERNRLNACLDALEDSRADAVRGAYLDGETYKELAARHGVPLNTMRTWLRRSLLKLRDCLSR